jgi:hypothetical protein
VVAAGGCRTSGGRGSGSDCGGSRAGRTGRSDRSRIREESSEIINVIVQLVTKVIVKLALLLTLILVRESVPHKKGRRQAKAAAITVVNYALHSTCADSLCTPCSWR